MKNGKLLTMIILLTFSLSFACGGCSGGGSDGGGASCEIRGGDPALCDGPAKPLLKVPRRL